MCSSDLQWPPMTMDFKLPSAALAKNLRKGDSVNFEFRLADDGQAELTAITPRASDAQAGKQANKK